MVIAPFVLAVGVFSQPPVPPRSTAAAPRFYAFGSVSAGYHPANGPLYHRLLPPLGGTAVDIALGGGGFISRRVGLEGELMFGGDVSAPQRFSYFSSEDYIGHHRALLLNELVRVRANRQGSVQFVMGGGYARTTTRETSIVATDSFGRQTMPPDGLPFTTGGLTWSAGADFVVASGAHVALAPSVRVRWVRIADPNYADGMSPLTWQFGATVLLR